MPLLLVVRQVATDCRGAQVVLWISCPVRQQGCIPYHWIERSSLAAASSWEGFGLWHLQIRCNNVRRQKTTCSKKFSFKRRDLHYHIVSQVPTAKCTEFSLFSLSWVRFISTVVWIVNRRGRMKGREGTAPTDCQGTAVVHDDNMLSIEKNLRPWHCNN